MKPGDWTELVRPVQMVLNQSPSPRVGNVSPIHVMMGIQPRLPLDGVLEEAVPVTLVGNVNEVRTLRAMQRALELRPVFDEFRQEVREASRGRRERSRVAAEKRGVKAHAGFDVGDFVLVAQVQPDKLQVRWAGPFRVIGVLSEWTYRVEDLVSGRCSVRHARVMKPYADKLLRVTEDLKEAICCEDKDWFRVEKLVEWRKRPRHPVEVLVKWEGFEDASCTWEPLARLQQDVPELVRDFVQDYTGPRVQVLRDALALGGGVVKP
jgi:hypothetical protein